MAASGATRAERAARRLLFARAGARGFTLIELMVVVAIIAILAVLALPNMGAAAIDRHVYEDASKLSDVIRVARSRAMGRGAAVAVIFDNSAGHGGLYSSRESVTADPVAGSTVKRVPSSNCMSPTDWSDATTYYEYDLLNLDGSYESSNGIKTEIYTGGPGSLTSVTKGAICFTPMGRTYLVTGSGPSKGMFDSSGPMLTGLLMEVARRKSSQVIGIARTVVIPSNGVARITSSGSLLQ